MYKVKAAPGAPKPFQYPVVKRPSVPTRVDRVRGVSDQEVLTGQVNGMDASNLEERFARALEKHQVEFDFQPSYAAGRNIQGEIRLDFMVYLGGGIQQPVNIDGIWIHSSAEAKRNDAIQDARLDELLNGNANPVMRVPGKQFPGFTFDSQENVDDFVQNYLVNGNG